jgi:tetratricopeptide (TPR) repeat protein
MDQFSAHLDRGWDLVQRGDSRGAELSARRALEIDAQSPEAHNLLGYVAALQGDFEEAIENYRQAIALDDTYLEAMLNAAEVYIHPLGDFGQAISLCDQALDLAENDDETVDTLLLMFDALLGKGDIDQARALCARFPPGPFDNPNHPFLVGRALYEVGNLDRAAPLIEKAVAETPGNPEAHYYLGLLLDERGDTRSATEAFLRSRELDLELPGPAWALTREAFADTVRRAILSLDPELRTHLREEELFVVDAPGIEVVVDGVDPRALLLLDAVQAQDDNGLPSARIFIYQRNVERLAGSIDFLEAEIKAAIEREISSTLMAPSPQDVSGLGGAPN